MIVDKVEENGDPVEMAEIDEAFELVRRRRQILDGDRRRAALWRSALTIATWWASSAGSCTWYIISGEK
jgi:hypothetical protein